MTGTPCTTTSASVSFPSSHSGVASCPTTVTVSKTLPRTTMVSSKSTSDKCASYSRCTKFSTSIAVGMHTQLVAWLAKGRCLVVGSHGHHRQYSHSNDHHGGWTIDPTCSRQLSTRIQEGLLCGGGSGSFGMQLKPNKHYCSTDSVLSRTGCCIDCFHRRIYIQEILAWDVCCSNSHTWYSWRVPRLDRRYRSDH
jgi:hypothetical protein